MGDSSYPYPKLRGLGDGSSNQPILAPTLKLLTVGDIHSGDEFEIYWNEVPNAESYKIEVINLYGNLTYIDNVSYGNTSYKLIHLAEDTYQIYVTAISGTQSAKSNSISVQILPSATDVEEYLVSYSLNGGTGSTPVTQSYEVGATVTVTLITPTRSGYRFVGWSDGTTTYAVGKTFEMPAHDVTLSAVWEKDKNTVSTPEQNLIAYKPKYSLSDSYKSGKYYQQLQSVELTGNLAQDFVNIAKSQVGYHEGSTSGDFSGDSTGAANYTEYGRYVNNANGAWCGFFVYWCIHAAGATNNIFPEKATGASVSPYLTSCCVYTWQDLVDGEVTPKIGDLVIFKSTGSADVSESSSLTGGSHIEIVYGYQYERGADRPYIFQTYGGNAGDGVVKDRTRLSCGSKGNTGWGGDLEYIYAIVRPKWDNNDSSAKKTVMTFHCPIDIEISYDGMVLSTASNQFSADFGTLAYNEEGDYYTATLDYSTDYQVVVTGKDAGVMDMTIAYYDEINNLISQAAFNNVEITTNRIITTSPPIAEEGIELYICDKLGNFVEAWRCEQDGCAENMDAELTEYYLESKVRQKKLCKRRQAAVKGTGANQGLVRTEHSPA